MGSLNQPLIRVAANLTAGPPGRPTADFAAVALGGSGGPTAVTALSTQRGRQYELGHAEAGTLTVDVTDILEYLNPANTASPWNSGANLLLPYRQIQWGAWWNTATNSTAGNLLNSANRSADTSTAYDPSFEASAIWWGSLTGSPTRSIVTTPVHSGTKAMSVTCGASTDVPVFRMMTVPGQTYTISLWINVAASHTVTMTFLDFPNAAGTTIGTAANVGTGAYERLVVTGKAVGAISAVKLAVTAGTFSTTFYVDDVQAELGATATTFTSSGPRYFPIYTGYIERYPQRWDNAGFRGLKPLTCVDALSVLSRTVITQSYLDTIKTDGPSLIIPYSDTGPPHTVQRPDGGTPMLGYTHPGTGGTVNYGGDTFLDGAQAISVVQQNASPPISGDPAYITYAGTRGGVLSLNPQAFTLEAWVKFTAGTIYLGAAALQLAEDPNGEATGPQKALQWYTGAGTLFVVFNDPNGGSKGVALGGGSIFPDGAWHYLTIMLAGTTLQSGRDAVANSPQSLGFTPSSSIGLDNFFLNATTYFADAVSSVSVAYLAAYPVVLSSTQRALHYQRGIGYLGELSGARALRLLTQYWSASVVTAAGVTTMAPDHQYNGRALLSALEEIADTEQGLIWVDTAGIPHFDSRHTRILAGQTATYVFGENTAAGELPYEAVEYDFDPTYVYSEADLSTYSGTVIKTVNPVAQANYGQRILSATYPAATDYQVQQAGLYFTTRYATPKLRIAKLSLNPATNPLLFTAVLSMDIGTRVTVKRRTSPGVTVNADYYVEQISHHVTPGTSDWLVELQCSPVFVPSAWILGDSTYGVLGSTTTTVY